MTFVKASLLDPVVEKVVHINATLSPHGDPGIWKKKTIWKPRWVKEWKSAKVLKPSWRKVWSPVFIKEWVPIPKPPPEDWESKSTPLSPLNLGPDGKIPLWDPMPYPESQQPPPIPESDGFQSGSQPAALPPLIPPNSTPFNKDHHHYHHHRNNHQCGQSECHDIPVDTFTLEQISKIIGSNRFKKAADYSSPGTTQSITDLSKSSDDSEKWRSRRENSFQFQTGRGFNNNLPNLPPLFLVPPKFLPLPNNNILNNLNRFTNINRQRQVFNGQTPVRENVSPTGGQLRQWTPIFNNQNRIPNNNQLQNRPSKLEPVNGNHRQNNNNNNNNNKDLKSHNRQNSQNGPNFIQPAELVGEYHYSELNGAVNGTNLKFKPLPTTSPVFLNLQDKKSLQGTSKINSLHPTTRNRQQSQPAHNVQNNHLLQGAMNVRNLNNHPPQPAAKADGNRLPQPEINVRNNNNNNNHPQQPQPSVNSIRLPQTGHPNVNDYRQPPQSVNGQVSSSDVGSNIPVTGKPRPIRKDGHTNLNDYQVQEVDKQVYRTLPPSLITSSPMPPVSMTTSSSLLPSSSTTTTTSSSNFEAEIIPVNDITVNVYPVYKPENASSNVADKLKNEIIVRNKSDVIENSKSFVESKIRRFELFYPKTNSSFKNQPLEESLITALQKVYPKNQEKKSEENKNFQGDEMAAAVATVATPTTTTAESPTTISSKVEILTKIPVFIVTPTRQNPSS
ncbi:conserved hypothetical protein [Pediculus humanus corporis]|uniref:Uncharacterized protein n=1 Tax=Pediculus humanus subsp. corporis TaxID=121224 RepID=E0VT13_PEDHC|nr:uncharacterized protein Phum_PHUM425150 [Pediculus humanus corporis]EEB16519.1 conserved hypothetical protein [Pediculus humanus corporis]